MLTGYTAGCFIEPHDDVAYKDVAPADADCKERGVAPGRYVRDIALVYYLTKEWDARQGGAFVDLKACGPGGSAGAGGGAGAGAGAWGREEHVPRFNSLCAFAVPRWHEVQAVAAGSRPRLSVFGWFYRRESSGKGGSVGVGARALLQATPAVAAAGGGGDGGKRKRKRKKKKKKKHKKSKH